MQGWLGANGENIMPMRGELPPVQARTCARQPTADTQRSWLVATVTDPNFYVVVAFALIGLLAMIDAIRYFPDLGAQVAQLSQFP
jgi:hypothetical protein